MINYGRVGSNDFPQVWKVVEQYVQKAIDRSVATEDVSVIADEILEGYQQLWIAYTDDRKIYGCVTTRIREYPDSKYLEIVYVAGNLMEYWVNGMLAAIEAFCLEQGCMYLEAQGRRGWMKHYKRHGFDEMYTVFRKYATDIVRH